MVLEREVVIEACPTSNMHTGCIASVLEHPVRRWLAYGVRACINTDNTLLSSTTARVEHQLVRQIAGMTDAELELLIEYGHGAAFKRS